MLFFSCSSIDKNRIIKSYLLDKNRINKFEEICNSNKIDIPDTIFISTIARSNRTFERHLFTEKVNNHNVFSIWIDCKEKFSLDAEDLMSLNNQILKSNVENNLIDDKKLTFNNFVFTNYNDINNINIRNSIIYHFSEPITSINNNYSIFYFECNIKTLEKSYCLKSEYILMEKKNKKWIFKGELCKNNILD